MSDPDLLPPGIDPKTRKIAIRSVTGHNDAGTRTEIRVRDFPPVATDEPDTLGGTNTAPSPLETVLVAFVGCMGVIINGCAKAMGFGYRGVDFTCSGQIDVRGPRGVPGVRPYFEKVSLEVVIDTDEPPERLARLEKNVEFRCPVTNLLRAAGVELDIRWRRRSDAPAGDG